jgi:hypothetical protein
VAVGWLPSLRQRPIRCPPVADPDILGELEYAANELGHGRYGALLTRAVAEIKRLRGLVGVASELPAEDQARLDRAYRRD